MPSCWLARDWPITRAGRDRSAATRGSARFCAARWSAGFACGRLLGGESFVPLAEARRTPCGPWVGCAAGAPQRQPLGGVPQSGAGRSSGSDEAL